MADQQPTTSGASTANAVITVDVPGDLVGQPGAGLITVQIPVNTSPQSVRDVALQMAREQAQGNRLGIESPTGQSVGFQLPTGAGGEGFSEAMTKAIAAVPEAASFIAQFFPQVRAFGLAGSMGIPAIARTGANFIEGKPLGQGVMNEALLGGALHLPQALGAAAKEYAPTLMKHNLFSQTPLDEISSTGEDFLPKKALELRAAPTKEGVADMQARAAANTHQGVQFGPEAELAEHLERVRKAHSVRGSGGSVNAILPGQGMTTNITRAAGLPAAVGQIASPAVAIVKGSPARRMAFARNLDRPGNLIDSDNLGLAISQLLRALAAAGMQPVASDEQATGDGGLPNRAPRRRGQQ